MKIATALVVSLATLAGCITDNTDDTTPGTPTPETNPFTPMDWAWQGEFLAGGIDEPHTYTFEVPEGATEIEGILTWTIPGAVLDFILLDPSGEEAADGWGESRNHRYVTTTKPVIPGNWSAVITIDQGIDVHYDFAVQARIGEPFGPISVTYEVQPNTFAEINFNMVPGDHFTFEWTATEEVYFNVHYHANGSTERPFEYTGTDMSDNFTAPNNEVYSMLWRNNGVLPVTVTASVDGVYRLHSMTRDAP